VKTLQNTATATATATATVKRVKKIEWKKDNLRHLFDHGLSVQFTDERKTAFLRSLVGKDETTIIRAGKSKVTLETVGRVTRCHFEDAIGNGFNSFSVSYFSPFENLSFTEKDEKTREVIEYVVYGNFTCKRYCIRTETGLPELLRIATGADVDALRAWSKSNSYAILGENGLRSKAIEKTLTEKRADVSRLSTSISYHCSDLERKRNFPFNGDIESARNFAKAAGENAENRMKDTETALATVRAMLATAETLSIYTSRRFESGYCWDKSCENETVLKELGATIGRVYVSESPLNYKPRAFFNAIDARYSVEKVKANYTVRRGEGGALVLSSGVVCPFNAETALAWLRGNGPAPSTQYGVCRKLETCDETGSPLVLIACGCHKIDVARDLGGEFAELLKPSHKAHLIEGKPALELSEETRFAFLARCEENAIDFISKVKAQRAEAFARYVQQKNRLTSERDNLPALLAGMEKQIEDAKAEKAKAEAELAETEKRFSGAKLEKVNDLARAMLSAFCLPRL